MRETEQQAAAKEFAKYWKGKGYEKGESQAFWLSLLRDVYGVEHPEQFIAFEEQVHLDHTSFIDGFISETKVLIEQKGLGKDLRKPIRQSDGTLLTPFQQAKRYITELPVSQHPKWVVTCNFSTFLVYDMDRPGGEPEEILLEDLEKEYYRLQFLVDSGSEHLKREMEVSIAAGEIVGLIYDAFAKQYEDPNSERAMKSLNVLCVRLVFCLYAEDAGIFGHHGMFHDYLAEFDARHMRRALIDLFHILDTKQEDRDRYLKDDNPTLAAFPYVNGGLFATGEPAHLKWPSAMGRPTSRDKLGTIAEDIEIPPFTDEIRDLLLNKASADFDWSEISPTIFGAVFESTLNPETRRAGGMHYTSIENIHKVIDPLFLDDLKRELEEIREIAVWKTKEKKLREFQKKLSSLTFLDPAAGSGNFLTETYISLRRLENQVLQELSRGQISFGDADWNPIQVSISQFYGIEINDFAVTVAKTALWIAESQMMKETESIVLMQLEFLPLKTNANITEGNALRLNWEDVVPKNTVNFIMGNPPFIGARLMTKEQKGDLAAAFGNITKGINNIDYVSGWYKKASDFIANTAIRVAFVSTNSIVQGEQAAILWKPLFEAGLHIDFAYHTFRWDSEAKLKAHVHCIIVGFSAFNNNSDKKLFLNDSQMKIVKNINAYLVDAPSIFVSARKTPICDVPEMVFGSMPNDGGALSDYSEEDMKKIVAKYPSAEMMFRPFIGATEFLHEKKRYCLWLKDIPASEIKKVPPVADAVASVRKMRETSNREATKKLASTPYLFGEIRQPETDYLIIPRHSSENRNYIPIGYVDKNVICGDSNMLMPNAGLYEFGILESDVHMAWMRIVCGRLEMRYRYSASIVYNNFPWPTPTEAQRARIEQTAQAILDARALYPSETLSDLYDSKYMKKELLAAHQNNDRAVMAAYGFKKDSAAFSSESACVAELMKMYQKLVEGK